MVTIPLAISSIRVYNEENLLFIEQKIFFFFSIFSSFFNLFSLYLYYYFLNNTNQIFNINK